MTAPTVGMNVKFWPGGLGPGRPPAPGQYLNAVVKKVNSGTTVDGAQHDNVDLSISDLDGNLSDRTSVLLVLAGENGPEGFNFYAEAVS